METKAITDLVANNLQYNADHWKLISSFSLIDICRLALTAHQNPSISLPNFHAQLSPCLYSASSCTPGTWLPPHAPNACPDALLFVALGGQASVSLLSSESPSFLTSHSPPAPRALHLSSSTVSLETEYQLVWKPKSRNFFGLVNV